MRIFSRINCLFGKHERNGRTATMTRDGTTRGYCKGCGKPMVKAGVNWRIET